jgi:hypothetical protein
VTHQLFEGVQLDSILEVNVVIAWNDIHVNIVFTEFIQEYLTIMVQRFEVDRLTVIVVVTKVQYLCDVVFEQVGKEHLTIEAFLILHKNVRRITTPAVGVI